MVGSLAGARVLDLYAGSGAVGLEALSRGAEHVLLVEHGARAARVIRENIEAIGLPGAVLVADRVERVLARGPAPAGGQDSTAPAGGQDSTAQDSTAQDRYDVVFADPPYALADAGVSRVLMPARRSRLAGAGGAGDRGARHQIRPAELAGRFRARPGAPVRGSNFLVRSRPGNRWGASAMTGLHRVLESRRRAEGVAPRATRSLSGFF